jgi:hypothetical protein
MKRCAMFKKATWAAAILLLASCVPGAALWAGDGAEKDTFVVVKGAHIITVTGDEIKKGTIVIKNGVIEAVGKNVEIPFPAEVIDGEGLWVMPGLINPCTLAGNRAYSRSGVRANMKVADELDPVKEIFEDILKHGFTTIGLAPRGSGIPGQAVAIRPVRCDCPSKVLNDAAFILMEIDSPSRDKRLLKAAFDTAKKEIEKREKAKKDWEEKQKKAAEEAKKKAEAEKKKAETEKKNGGEKKVEKKVEKKDGKEGKEGEKKDPPKFTPPPYNPPYAPIVDLIQKKEGVKALVVFGQASDFVHFQDGLKDYEFARAFLLRNRSNYRQDSDLPLVADKLGELEAEVVVYPVVNFKPLTQNRINLPRILTKAGCKVSFRTVDDTAASHGEQLRVVAELVKGGFKREDALKALTLHPAEFLGIADRVGSIEKGREADLLFLTGDPFDELTKVEKVMVKGHLVEGRHEIQ